MSSARDLTLTLYGRFLRERGSWIAISQLVRLLEPLGVDAASTRSAISRLKRDGLVDADERSGLAGYSLTPVGEAFFADGEVRVHLKRDTFAVLGARSPHSLVDAGATYGEESTLWSGDDTRGFARIFGLPSRIARKRDA